MTPTKGIIEYVCEYYEGTEGLDDITFIPEFPGKRHDLPLRGKIVSVGIDRVRVMPAENAVKIANNASPATMRIKMCICAPSTTNGKDCYNVLDRIIENSRNLVALNSVACIETGELKYSNSITGLLLPLYITLNIKNMFDYTE